MSAQPLYQTNSDLPELETSVRDMRPAMVLLDQSIVFAGGSGQLPDLASIQWEHGEAAITGVTRDEHGWWYSFDGEAGVAGPVSKLGRQVMAWHKSNAASKRLVTIPGIGPLAASVARCLCRQCRQLQERQELDVHRPIPTRAHDLRQALGVVLIVLVQLHLAARPGHAVHRDKRRQDEGRVAHVPAMAS
ncbi:protein of unknown function [Hyphomicrobium sp. 1Nfss2.1]